MSFSRRKFVRSFTASAIASPILSGLRLKSLHAQVSPQAILKPPRLRNGDTIGLIAPASIVDEEDVKNATEALGKLGLRVKLGKHVLDKYGYLAGTDQNRAGDFNRMVADPSVKAIIAMRGGWGCNRILPLLDYRKSRSHPKIILGYSDITSLLLAVYARSRVVTFHGPVATSTWNSFSVEYIQSVLFAAQAMTMRNPSAEASQLLISNQVTSQIINPGIAQGHLLGGNLSVLCSMVGSSYLPSWNRQILFLEDIGEDVYRIDRMLSQLKNAGILSRLSGLIFGQCTNCKPSEGSSLTLQQVLHEYISPLGIPAWYGSPIGHIKDKFTLPLGIKVEINASLGTIQMLEPAVT